MFIYVNWYTYRKVGDTPTPNYKSEHVMSYLYVRTATVFHDPFSLSLLVAVEYLYLM